MDNGFAPQRFIGVRFDDVDLIRARDAIFAAAGEPCFRYVVTPNVAHLVAITEDRAMIQPLFDAAWLSVCDSRVLRRLASVTSDVNMSVVPGSDLTEALLLGADERGLSINIIGSFGEDAGVLRQRYPGLRVKYFEAPMGLRRDPKARAECVRFALENPADLTFIGVGMPQQEMLAHELLQADARGIGLCIGASIDFLVGRQKRAPVWMQKSGLEWAFRLMTDPKRLAKRYLWECPRIFVYAFIK